MSKWLLMCSLVFGALTACSGEISVGDGVEEKDDVDEDDEDAEPEAFCCEYEGPLGTTHDLTTDAKVCGEKYGDKGGKIVSGDQCEPVCCKAPKEPEDLAKGYSFEVSSKSTCEHRKGEELAADDAQCATKPATKPVKRPQPKLGPKTRPAGR